MSSEFFFLLLILRTCGLMIHHVPSYCFDGQVESSLLNEESVDAPEDLEGIFRFLFFW